MSQYPTFSDSVSHMTTNTLAKERTLDDLMTSEQAADMLGVHINTLRNWVKKGIVPEPRRYGPRKWRFLPEDIQGVIDEVLK